MQKGGGCGGYQVGASHVEAIGARRFARVAGIELRCWDLMVVGQQAINTGHERNVARKETKSNGMATRQRETCTR